MSVYQAPSKGSTLAVAFVRLIVQHLDYAKLVALSATCIALEEQVQQTLATLIGHSLLPQQIQVQLQPGSVLVDARVVDPTPAQIRHWQSKLNTTLGFEANLQASILGISGIQSACTGPVAITNVEAGVEEATQKKLAHDSTNHHDFHYFANLRFCSWNAHCGNVFVGAKSGTLCKACRSA